MAGPGRRRYGRNPPGDFSLPLGDAVRMRKDFEQVMALIFATIAGNVTTAICRLDIPDLLADGPKTSAELAEAAGADPDSMYRLVRAAAAYGVLTETEPGRFALTDVGETLRATPGSLRDLVLAFGDPGFRTTASALDTAVRKGRSPAPEVLGSDLWTFFHAHPDEAAHFIGAMGGVTVATMPGILDALDATPYKRIVDIGGSQGEFLTALLERTPGATGVLFDQPHVVDGAPAHDRIEPYGGDLFGELPPGGDLYVLKNVLHDWNATDAGRILDGVRKAGAPGHRVTVIEWLIPDGGEDTLPFSIDVFLFAVVGGHIRTEAEWRELFAAHGYELSGNIGVPGGIHLVSATAV